MSTFRRLGRLFSINAETPIDPDEIEVGCPVRVRYPYHKPCKPGEVRLLYIEYADLLAYSPTY